MDESLSEILIFLLKLRIELFLYSFLSQLDKKSIFSCDYLSFCSFRSSEIFPALFEGGKRETNFVFRRMIFFGRKAESSRKEMEKYLIQNLSTKEN